MTGRCALLLRAVNVSGTNRVPMAELRSLLSERGGLQNVSTYIASGNIICDAPHDLASACADVRALVADEFGVDTPVIARTHADLARVERADPFGDAGLDKMVHVMFLEGEAAAGAVDQLTEQVRPGERIALVGRELWIDYGQGGVASTKLTRAVLDRALGTAGTARNRKTLRTLVELTATTARA
ncbi:DUF1697 domain-containing protein [Microbacterium sp. NPDC055521]